MEIDHGMSLFLLEHDVVSEVESDALNVHEYVVQDDVLRLAVDVQAVAEVRREVGWFPYLHLRFIESIIELEVSEFTFHVVAHILQDKEFSALIVHHQHIGITCEQLLTDLQII